MDFSVIDDCVQVHDKEAFAMCKHLAVHEGLMVGGSAGLNVFASMKLAATLDEGVIVTVLCDSGQKYLSKVFNQKWVDEKVGSFDTVFEEWPILMPPSYEVVGSNM